MSEKREQRQTITELMDVDYAIAGARDEPRIVNGDLLDRGAEPGNLALECPGLRHPYVH
jgi:hypothetical protein